MVELMSICPRRTKCDARSATYSSISDYQKKNIRVYSVIDRYVGNAEYGNICPKAIMLHVWTVYMVDWNSGLLYIRRTGAAQGLLSMLSNDLFEVQV